MGHLRSSALCGCLLLAACDAAPVGPGATSATTDTATDTASTSTTARADAGAAPLSPGVHVRPLKEPFTHGAQIRPDGRGLAAWSGELDNLTRVELWDFDANPVVRTLPLPELKDSPVHMMSTFFWSGDKKTLAATGGYSVVAWDLQTGKLELEDYYVEVWGLLSPRKDRLFVTTSFGGLGILDFAHPTRMARHELHPGDAPGDQDIAWLGETVLSAVDGRGRVWFLDAKTVSPRRAIDVNVEGAPLVAATPKGDWIALATKAGGLELLDGKTLSTKKTLLRVPPRTKEYRPPAPDAVSALAFSPDGKSLAVSRGDGSLASWDVATGQSKKVFAKSGATCGFLEYAPDGAHLVCGVEGKVLLWDVTDSAPASELPWIKGSERSWLDGGARLALVEQDGDVALWETKTGRRADVRHLLAVESYISSWTDDFRFRESSPADTRIERLSDGKSIRLRTLVNGGVTPVVYNDEGLFAGDDDVCRNVLVRVDAAGVEGDPTSADCAERRRPDLLAAFLADKHD